ncbi:NEW3 domain-containing protein [Streptomyces sp. NBC_01023]|uniref:NEW3 domain-containing protein n=1 Tax=Streptomyces sp. NBC_01023 TaxID=2903724 RepID=UPI00386F6319|nr:NEW3 domain-containing protein [Streptomyces sp. NBC_01023]
MPKRRNTALRAATAAFTLALAAGFVPGAQAAPRTPFTIAAGTLRIGLDPTGTVTSLVDAANGHDYASTDHLAPLIKLVADGAEQRPTALSYDHVRSTFTFTFGAKGIKVGIRVVGKSGYATLEATGVSAPQGVDVQTLLWGPITTDISQTVGETVGVVHDKDFAIGIHGLNDKTPAGWPEEYKGLSYPDAPGDPLFNWDYGWFAAHRTTFGGILQAYTYDYTKTRNRYVGWGDTNEPSSPVPPLSGDDARIEGSKIALFGSAPDATLGTLSRIETGEGLPHPTVDGQWQKTAQGASQSFLVLGDLNKDNVDQASAFANQAGLRYVYSLPGSDGPWQSAGHYQFDSAFGGSDAGAAQLVSKAADHGVKVGVHTLSNLVDTNDPYATPVPSKGLATLGSVKLTRPLDASSTVAYVDGDSVFKDGQEKILRIGDEFAEYSAVTQVPGSAGEYEVRLGSRGMWGTSAVAHADGDAMDRMRRYAYGQFVGGMPVMGDIAARFAQISNTTGTKSMSYDGLETGSLAGYGLFGTNRLVNGTYRNLKSQDDFISEASNLLPGTWDATTRASWGEDHGLPERAPLTALKYMPYFDRNDMPDMMGWRGFRSGFSTLSQEWLLSKMAGYNAGTGLQTTVSTLKSAGNTTEVLAAWKEWEAARNAHAFTSEQTKAMRDTDSNWHLETVVPGKQWNLYDVDFPAGPLSAPNDGSQHSWSYTNTHAAQPVQFQLQASGGTVTDPSFTVDGQTVGYRTTVPSGGYLVADGSADAKVYDGSWHLVDTVAAQGSATFKSGAQNIDYRATGSGGTSKISFLTYGSAQRVKAPVTIDSPATVKGGGTATVTTRYTNTGTTTVKNARIGLAVPTGWRAEHTGKAGFPSIAPGETVSVTWRVTPPVDTRAGDSQLVTHVTSTGARTSSEASTRITVS